MLLYALPFPAPVQPERGLGILVLLLNPWKLQIKANATGRAFVLPL